MPQSFEDEFPNEPLSPTAVGSSSATNWYGGYVAPGNVFTPIPVGFREGEFRGSIIPFPQGKTHADVIRESAPYTPPGATRPADDPTVLGLPHVPFDWEAYDAATLPAPKVEYADVPVISPDTSPTGTVRETSPGDPVAEEPPVSIWGDIGSWAGDVIGEIGSAWVQGWPEQASPVYQAPVAMAQPFPVGGWDLVGTPPPAPVQFNTGAPSMATAPAAGACPPPNARYLRYNCQTGALSKIPRKRRKKLFSASDLKDIAALKTLIGGGAALNGVVVAAIRR